MGCIPALFTNGRIVVGSNHGEAFGKLDPNEQNGQIDSGFIDPITNRFIGDDQQFFLKEIILIRHAHPYDYFDPCISNDGHSQCNRMSDFISKHFNPKEFKGYSSCCNRTRETAEKIFWNLGIPFEVNPDFCDQRNWELPCWRAANNWAENDKTFIQRINRIMEYLPNKSIIVSHFNFIIGMVKLCIGNQPVKWNGLPFCSLTYINYNKVVCVGENNLDQLKW